MTSTTPLMPTLLITLSLGGCLADIRPEPLQEDDPGATAEREGRALLDRARLQHGGDATWAGYQTAEVVLRDHWNGFFVSMFSPWPESDQRMRFRHQLGTFYAQTEFLDGEAVGERWGVQAWRTYRVASDGAIDFSEDEDIRFIIPTVQYFLELPFRIHEAPIVRAAGAESIDGRIFDRVFATWRTVEPNTTDDQYVIYIARDTGRMEKVEYTVRDIMRNLTGTMHYADFREIGGLMVPFVQSVTTHPDDDPEDYMHRMTLESVKLDGVPPEALVVDPKLPFTGGTKPAT